MEEIFFVDTRKGAFDNEYRLEERSMYDCIIIGTGISGSTLAYQCSQYQGKLLVLEKENDVSQGTTKANSAILHAGYDPEPGSLMAKYNVLGNKMTPEWCKNLQVRFQQVGSLVLAFDEADRQVLETLFQRGKENGVPDLQILEKEAILKKEPEMNTDVVAALYAPTAGIMDPWDLAIACCEVAATNGAEFQFNQEVINIERKEDFFLVYTCNHCYKTKMVVNAAGVYCDTITRFLYEPDYEIVPTKGEYYLLDKSQGHKANHILFQCPNEKGKGVLVAPTVHGNLIVGPSTTQIEQREDLSTTKQGLESVKEKALLTIPSIQWNENIRNFAGLRARRKSGKDFIIGRTKIKGFYQLAAMASPGLSCAVSIAVDIHKQFQEEGFFIQKKEGATFTRKVIRLEDMSFQERKEWIQRHPLYGRIVCRCESISEGEIVDSLYRSIGVHSLDGVKRRCNAGMGRCQGGFCGVKIHEIIARECSLSYEEVLQDKQGSYIVSKPTKETSYE